jgi:hypothetical protein
MIIEHEAKTWNGLLGIIERHFTQSYSWIFRGQADYEWGLIPKIGRMSSTLTEKDLFEAWKRYALHYLTREPRNNWDWLAIAQHHGLATRLLDWTKSPLNAIFFAVDKNLTQNDAAIFAMEVPQRRSKINYRVSPFGIEDYKVFFPKGLSPRILSQRGVFTITPRITEPFENIIGNIELHKIRISYTAFPEIRRFLDFYNVNHFTIYQDIDSLSDYLNTYTAGIFYI